MLWLYISRFLFLESGALITPRYCLLFQELFSRISQALQQKAASLQDLSSVQESSSSGGIDIKKIETGNTSELLAPENKP